MVACGGFGGVVYSLHTRDSRVSLENAISCSLPSFYLTDDSVHVASYCSWLGGQPPVARTIREREKENDARVTIGGNGEQKHASHRRLFSWIESKTSRLLFSHFTSGPRRSNFSVREK